MSHAHASIAHPLLSKPAELAVAADGSWFRAPGRRLADLARRPTLRRIVHALVTARIQRAGSALRASELVAIGWPGATDDAAKLEARLYFAIYVLREKGIRTILMSREDGYLLDPETPLRIELKELAQPSKQ